MDPYNSLEAYSNKDLVVSGGAFMLVINALRQCRTINTIEALAKVLALTRVIKDKAFYSKEVIRLTCLGYIIYQVMSAQSYAQYTLY